MPHRSFLGVVRGDAKENGKSKAKVSDTGSNLEVDTPASSVSSHGQPSEVAGHPHTRRPSSHVSSNVLNDSSTMETLKGNSRSNSPTGTSLQLLKSNSSEQGLWRQAWDEVTSELAEILPPEFEPIDTLDTRSQVQKVREEAQKRAEEAGRHQRKIPHTNETYRQIYGKVANCANKFQIVGDLISQAEPVYAALPWALIRFAIQCAVGEDEAYHTMLSGTELVSDLTSQYPALEQLYARIDSQLSKKLRKSLIALYKTILQFQVNAINYFDPNCKVRRTLKGMNPVTADDIKHLRQNINETKHFVDEDAALVSYEVAKLGIDNLKAGQKDQDQQLEAIKDGIKALAGNTGEAFRNLSREQQDLQQKRHDTLVSMWKEPMDDLMAKLENQEIEKARRNMHNVRRWLSVAMPRDDLLAAREKRSMELGNWLLKHQNFQHWMSSEHSAMLWLHGFAGTGKTGLVCRVIRQLEKSVQKSGRLAFFFCSNDKADTVSEERYSRSDPEEALRSIVSQLATSQDGNYVEPILQRYYDTFGPDSDQSSNLVYSDCIDILVTVAEYTPINIVFDAFDECDRAKSPRLVQNLQELIRRSPENVKVFISTRAFPAIEDNMMADESIEVTAADNSVDVRAFIRSTLDDRINEKALLNGNVSEELRNEIEITLSSRASSMFLYASLLLNQLCNKNYNDDEASIRKKLSSLPRDITDVYNRIMAEIHDDRNNSERSCLLAQSTFRWLLCAQEPLPYDALLEAVSPPERKAKHEEVIRACRTLVVKGRHAYEFAHYSVREHVGQMLEYSASRCHLVATQSCLNILSTSFGSGKRNGLSEAQESLEQYALFYWPVHY